VNDDQVFRAALLVIVLIVFPIGIYHRLQSQSTREPLDRRQEGLFILATLRPIGIVLMGAVISYLISPASMAWSSVPLPPWLRWLGVVLAAMAGALLLWAFRRLGKNLTDTVVTRRAHTLVTHGPYRWVRHPFYVSVAMFVLGTALIAANWFFLVAGALAVGLLVLRTPREEERLLARFGDSYRAYMDRTGRFLPQIRTAARRRE
jgi:protein-S-isoprenylcysteine O-methyltransferase Ste14